MEQVDTEEEYEVSVLKFKSLKQLNRYRNLCLWLPIPIVAKNVPWGYEICLTDPKVASPNAQALTLFIKAGQYLKSHSYEVVSQWLKSKGFPISDVALMNMVKERPFWPELKLPIEERKKLCL